MKANLSAIQTKLIPIIFGLILFFVAFYAVKGVARGNLGNAKFLGALVVAVGVILMLDKKYWIICPASQLLQFNIPQIPFNSEELGCLTIIAMYFVRLGLHKEQPIKFNGIILWALPVLFWMCFIFALNPAGMNIFGGTSIGSRFYIKILLGFFTMCIFSSLSLSEKDCRLLFRVLLISSILAFLKTISSGVDSSEYSNTNYQLLGTVPIFMLVFSHYSLRQILLSWFKIFICFVCLVMTIYSGKRRGLGTLLVIPILRTFFTGREKMLTFCCFAVGLFFCLFLVIGDGLAYDLPKSVQRSLSTIVPKYADNFGGTTDIFREEVWKYGRRVIRQNPWFGRKGFAMNRMEMSWVVHRDVGVDYEGHALAGNWHSTWYSYACDFGIPCLVLWVIFTFYYLFYVVKVVKKSSELRYTHSCALYYALFFFTEFCFSYTSGHSSLTTFKTWVQLGVVIAIYNGSKNYYPCIVSSTNSEKSV